MVAMTLMEDVETRIRRYLAEQAFVGVVTSVSGNQIGVKRPGQSVADGQTYAAASGLAAGVSVNDLVSVQRHGGSWVVCFKIVS